MDDLKSYPSFGVPWFPSANCCRVAAAARCPTSFALEKWHGGGRPPRFARTATWRMPCGHLVGCWMIVSNIWKNNKCSKPPTRHSQRD